MWLIWGFTNGEFEGEREKAANRKWKWKKGDCKEGWSCGIESTSSFNGW
jgi:hypothetical protein